MSKQVKSPLFQFTLAVFVLFLAFGLSACGSNLGDTTSQNSTTSGEKPRMSDAAKNAVLISLAKATENPQENKGLEISGPADIDEILGVIEETFASIVEVVLTTIDEICQLQEEANGTELDEIPDICEIDIDGEILLSPFGIIEGFLEVCQASPEMDCFLCDLNGQNLEELLNNSEILDEICSFLPECLDSEDCDQGEECVEGFCQVLE